MISPVTLGGNLFVRSWQRKSSSVLRKSLPPFFLGVRSLWSLIVRRNWPMVRNKHENGWTIFDYFEGIIRHQLFPCRQNRKRFVARVFCGIECVVLNTRVQSLKNIVVLSVILYSLVVSMFASVDLKRFDCVCFWGGFCDCVLKKVSLKQVWYV